MEGAGQRTAAHTAEARGRGSEEPERTALLPSAHSDPPVLTGPLLTPAQLGDSTGLIHWRLSHPCDPMTIHTHENWGRHFVNKPEQILANTNAASSGNVSLAFCQKYRYRRLLSPLHWMRIILQLCGSNCVSWHVLFPLLMCELWDGRDNILVTDVTLYHRRVVHQTHLCLEPSTIPLSTRFLSRTVLGPEKEGYTGHSSPL